ncbi:MAG: copper amine oxidase N-terminal domain-containing protein [Clostridiales bacterium]|jgi:hypothetical protein|nr:copper amine oxidase N-terminal domain-containing protein [Clostridiales bacterium]
MRTRKFLCLILALAISAFISVAAFAEEQLIEIKPDVSGTSGGQWYWNDDDDISKYVTEIVLELTEPTKGGAFIVLQGPNELWKQYMVTNGGGTDAGVFVITPQGVQPESYEYGQNYPDLFKTLQTEQVDQIGLGYYIPDVAALPVKSLTLICEMPDKAPEPTPKPVALTAQPTASKVLVNGKEVAFGAYNISGFNYFKLRDLAYALSGTPKQFEVGWDAKAEAITLTSGKAYTVAGGELEANGAGIKTPVATSSLISINGKAASLAAYNIDSFNYFQLRDIGKAFNFSVGWEAASSTITIDTSKGYTE